MVQEYTVPETPLEQPKKSNTPLIIAIVVAVLLCCCCLIAVIVGLYQNGDQILDSLGITVQQIGLFFST